MKKIMFVVLLCIVSAGAAFGQKKVAILETIDRDGNVPYAIELALRAGLTTGVTGTTGYEGYDRVDLSSVFGEQDFQRTGVVSDEQIHKLGEITGASYVLIAEAAMLDVGNIIITAKIVNVETAHIDGSALKTLSTDPSKMLEECKELAAELLSCDKEAGFLDIDGCKYKGETLEGKPHGRGIMYYPESDTRLSFEGTFVNGAVKQGLLTFRDGETYEGGFGDGVFNGYGVYKFINGDRYEGYWEAGEKNGKGKYLRSDGNSFVGMYANEKRNGYGVMRYSDGSRYEGNWKDGKKTDGTFYYKESSEYEYFKGHWNVNGKMSGYGLLQYRDGTYSKGTWENGKKKGAFKRYRKDGSLMYTIRY